MREIRMEKRERENNGGGEIEKEGIQGERNSETQMEKNKIRKIITDRETDREGITQRG
jgi:hypothetical protein